MRLQHLFQNLLWEQKVSVTEDDDLCQLSRKLISPKNRLLLSNLNEDDFYKPDFKISDLFQKYLCQWPAYINIHQHQADKMYLPLFELYATIEGKAMLQIFPYIEPKLPIISPLE